MQAHLLSLNKFNMPKVIDGSDANYVHIVYLLLLEPGTFQSHPDMGIGLRHYRFVNNDPLPDLRSQIAHQINNYLPELANTDITLTLGKDHILGIVINTTEGAYALAYNSEKDIMDVGAVYVLDQL